MNEKSFKNRYLELVGNKPYSKGIRKSIVDSVMRGSIPSVDAGMEIAKALDITVEELLTGRNPEKVLLRDADERIYVEKLLRILRSNDDLMKRAIIPNLDAFDGRLIQTEEGKKNSKQKGP